MKKELSFLCIVLAVAQALHAADTLTLAQLQHYLIGIPEAVSSDNHDWEDPEYTTFYKMQRPSWVDSLFHQFKLITENPWTPHNIERVLKNVLATRRQFIERGAFAVHLMTKPETKFAVWGDLFGAAHSLLRDLQYFYRRGVIDQQLRIVQPEYNFVFLGNAIDRAPYSLEVLFIILVLMERNPDRVFYLKGKHETNNYWKNFGLKREIAHYFGQGIVYSKHVAEFEKLLSDLFDSFPGALYISQKDASHDVLALSSQIDNYPLSFSYFERFFKRDVGSVDYIPVAKSSSEKEYSIVAIVEGGDEIKTSFGSQGLQMVSPVRGSTVWSIISCPTLSYQKYFNIYYDAFAMIVTGQAIAESTIQLVSQDIRNKQGFTHNDLLNIMTGETVKPLGLGDIYRVGSTMALTKSLQDVGTAIKFSMFNLINASNESNFLPGHFIRVIILDDEYSPNRAIKNIEKLMQEYKIDSILLPVGSPTLEAYFNEVKAGKLSVFFPVTGSPDFRAQDYKNIIHWRASYQDEARALIEYMISENASKKFAFFYQNDSYGLGALEAAHELLKAKGITDWVDIPYNKSGITYDDAVAAIRKAQPDAIGLFSIPEATEGLFRKLGIELLVNKKLFGLSFIADEAFRSYAKDQGLKVLFAQAVPNPRTSDLEIVKEFRAFMDRYNHPYDLFALEGYIGTSLYLEALKTVPQPTAETMMRYFETFKNFSYKGLEMTFNARYRSLGQSVWIEVDEHHWKEYKVQSFTQTPNTLSR